MKITGKTKLLGILGDPVSHSLSPLMHNHAFEALDLDMCYVPLHVKADHLEAAIDGLRAMEFLGANVTIPHKLMAMALMDRLSDSAIKVGAVNTIVNDAGLLVGHNTDGAGFIRSLEETASIDYAATSVVLLGAGGAARSVAFALAEKGISKIAVINRTLERAEELKSQLERDFPSMSVVIRGINDDYGDLVSTGKLVINATSLGLVADLKSAPVWVDRLTKDHVVCDIVYRAQEKNPLLVAARDKGATTLGGLGMLLHQGAIAFHLWTGIKPPIEVMRNSIEP
ncbi:MAG: shikimate dehydrogenase [Thermoleophilia bacterium]